jgi:hypothetical protein
MYDMILSNAVTFYFKALQDLNTNLLNHDIKGEKDFREHATMFIHTKKMLNCLI